MPGSETRQLAHRYLATAIRQRTVVGGSGRQYEQQPETGRPAEVPPPEIIVDPNVWVSALISPGGTTAGVLRAVLSDEVTAIVTPHLLEELSAVLERDEFRRWVSLADARVFVAALSDKADLRPDAGKPRRSARDPDDDYLVALAEETGAVIVTGDDDLLSLNFTPPAITPRAHLDLLESLR